MVLSRLLECTQDTDFARKTGSGQDPAQFFYLLPKICLELWYFYVLKKKYDSPRSSEPIFTRNLVKKDRKMVK